MFVYILRHLFTLRDRLGQGRPPYLFISRACDVTSVPNGPAFYSYLCEVRLSFANFRENRACRTDCCKTKHL